jgi:hypothetical protein
MKYLIKKLKSLLDVTLFAKKARFDIEIKKWFKDIFKSNFIILFAMQPQKETTLLAIFLKPTKD